MKEESEKAFQKDEAEGDGTINEMIWDQSWVPKAFDVDLFMERVRAMKDPEPGTVLRFWNPNSKKCSWCVFLRLVDGSGGSSGSGGEESESGAASSSSAGEKEKGGEGGGRKRSRAGLAPARKGEPGEPAA